MRHKGTDSGRFPKKACQKSYGQENAEIMKKLILNPTKDTIVLCLPETWVGKPVICFLREPDNESTEMVGMASEDAIFYQAAHFRKLAKRRPRRKRLRKQLL